MYFFFYFMKIYSFFSFVALSTMIPAITLAGGCENPVEAIDPVTAEIYMECPMPEGLDMVPPDYQEYDYFTQEETRIANVIQDISQSILNFSSFTAGDSPEEKREEYSSLEQQINELRWEIFDFKRYNADTVDKKQRVSVLEKNRKGLLSQLKIMKKQLDILSVDEFSVIQSVNDSFVSLTDSVNSAKEMATLVDSDLSADEKRKVKRTLRILDVLYVKAQKQATGIHDDLVNRSAEIDTWTIQNKYYQAETKTLSAVDNLMNILTAGNR